MFVNEEKQSAYNIRIIKCALLPEGALPMDTLPTPLYIPRHPPFARKPPGAWRRVLTVSIGKSDRSTATPANAPAAAAVGSSIYPRTPLQISGCRDFRIVKIGTGFKFGKSFSKKFVIVIFSRARPIK